MKQNLHGVYLTDVLTEMCRRVGVEYTDIDFSEDAWYEQHTWSQTEKDKFIAWFAKFLHNMGPRREICRYPPLVRTTSERMKFAEKFVEEFAWKVV